MKLVAHWSHQEMKPVLTNDKAADFIRICTHRVFSCLRFLVVSHWDKSGNGASFLTKTMLKNYTKRTWRAWLPYTHLNAILDIFCMGFILVELKIFLIKWTTLFLFQNTKYFQDDEKVQFEVPIEQTKTQLQNTIILQHFMLYSPNRFEGLLKKGRPTPSW